MRVPMFLPYQARGDKPKAPAQLHAWVRIAHERTRAYRANPNRPQVRAIEDGEIRDIVHCTPPRLEYGDVVGLVFTVVYTETPANWSPVYMLTNIIRVMHANRDAYPLTAADPLDDPPPDDGELSITNVAPSELLRYIPGAVRNQPNVSRTATLGTGHVVQTALAPATNLPEVPPAPAGPLLALPPATATANAPEPRPATLAGRPPSPHQPGRSSAQITSEPVAVSRSIVAEDSPPPPYAAAPQATDPENNLDGEDDDATSSTTEATRGSRDATPAARGRRTSGGAVRFVRTVRPRLDDAILDVPHTAENSANQSAGRVRRGPPAKGRAAK